MLSSPNCQYVNAKTKNLVGDHFFSLFDVIAAGLPDRLSNTIRYAHDYHLYASNTIVTPKTFHSFPKSDRANLINYNLTNSNLAMNVI